MSRSSKTSVFRSLLLAAGLAVAAACAPQAAAPARAPGAAACPPASSSASAQLGAISAPPAGAPAARTAAYEKPPQAVLDVLHAPSPPNATLNSTRDTMILSSWVDYPPIARVAEPMLPLAGVRVEPKNRSVHGSWCASQFVLVKMADGTSMTVELPAGACAGSPSWSADGKRYVFRNIAEDGVELWIGDRTDDDVRPFGGLRLNPMLDSPYQWMPDQKTLLVKLVPPSQGPAPAAATAPIAPSVSDATGAKGQSSTYELRDVLKSPHDEDLFDYYAASQLALVDAATGHVTPIGGPAAYAEVTPAPDGEHILVATIKRPYSYVTTEDRFPRAVEIWDRAGNVVQKVADVPLADRVPVHGVRTGPRDFAWRATAPATLVWAEALDGGDWNTKVPKRDKVMMWSAPWSAPAAEIARTDQRFTGFSWADQPTLAFVNEEDEIRHWERVSTMNVDDPKTPAKVVFDHSSDEHYKHPGWPVFHQLPNGEWVVQQDGDSVFLAGQGSSPDGDRPFLDRFDTRTGQTERLFRSEKTGYEYFVAFTDVASRAFVTRHESPTDPPNFFLRGAGAKVASPTAGEAAYASTSRAITHLADPAPAVRAIKKRLVKYKRADGLDLSFTLYLPPDYQEGQRLPTVLGAYPLDYADKSVAGQVTGSEQRFTVMTHPDYLFCTLAGYAVLANASIPIIGDTKKIYDTYLDQLVAGAKAAVDKAVELGVTDRDRIGVTGHSHGALMTANLLLHSDLFRAGVAESGAYNRSLTPFGFQNERRSVWEAEDVYLKVSPFFHANEMKYPILLIHGDADANPGTVTLQSQKFFEALRGNGAVARLVLLPYESHGYQAMESNEQVLHEMIRWFDLYVKNAPARGGATAGGAPGGGASQRGNQ